jgi:hypothetical protein
MPPTVTAGGATLGYCVTGNRNIDITPPSIIRIAITHANIGRLIKNSDIITCFAKYGTRTTQI